MAKRLILLSFVFFVLPASALAATVKVRVEGQTQTLFAPTEATVTAASAQDALEQASLAGEFYYHVTVTGFGPYVDQVGRYGGTASSGWVFKVNDVSPPVGADKVVLKDGDRVLWYYATFGPQGGPPTLSVKVVEEGVLRRAGLRRQRQGSDRDRPRLPHRLEAHGQGQPERRRLSRVRIRACSSARRRPVRSARTP